jgi:gamma-glutamylcysteine synthetase
MKILILPVALLAGCGIFVQPTNPADIAVYNNQIFQLLMPIATAVVTVLGFVGLWIKSNIDKRELAQTTQATAREVAHAAKASSEQVLEKVQENTEINVTAIETANSHNEKILALQQQVAEQTKRAPARATDHAEGPRQTP